MLHDLFNWIAHDLGKGQAAYGQSWAEALAGSLNFWGLTEGTHLLTLMLFAGSIFIVDLRLLGVIFRQTPVSVISKKLLPLTIVGFVIMVATGLVLFLAKPVDYYHSIWFRFKLIFLAVAMINIVVFHTKVARNESEWDGLEIPPKAARVSAAVSLAAWCLVIMMGRFIPYSWMECGKPQPGFVNWAEACAAWPERGAIAMTEGGK